MTDWSLAVTAPQCEHLVCRDLRERFNIPYHFFQQKKRLVHRGQVVERLVPAFPSYVMVPLEAAWEVARYCWRVIGLVRWGEQIEPVPQSIIDELLARCEGDHLLPTPEVPEPFIAGDRVMISGYGPMAGHAGIYQERVDSGKLSVQFDWMGRWVSIDVDECDVGLATMQKRSKKRKHRLRRGKSKKLV